MELLGESTRARLAQQAGLTGGGRVCPLNAVSLSGSRRLLSPSAGSRGGCMSWDHDTIEPVWQDAARWRPRFDATRRAAPISRPLAYPADAPRGDPRLGHTLRAGLRALYALPEDHHGE